MNRLEYTFKTKQNILNIYITAGYPRLNDTIEIANELAKSGVDILEIGMPFSDPLADGPTIQESSEIAIKNGITINTIFEQIKIIRENVKIPIVLMGYFNQLLKYGVENFLKEAQKVGVDGVIIPDLPLSIYQNEYKNLFNKYSITISFLITPQTSQERVLEIAKESNGFLYMVSSYSITGSKKSIENYQKEYFAKIAALNISTPKLIGFGISSKKDFDTACNYSNGAIIGSAFIKKLKDSKNIKKTVNEFVNSITTFN